MFFGYMQRIGVHPFAVTGDHVRLYKEALVQSGKKPGTTARALSVIRGTYEQFGKKGFVPWSSVGDIQAVSAPRVEKNTTPSLSEQEAIKLLHAPDTSTVLGARDHALLFAYFKTACRSAAIRKAKVGDLERTDTEFFIVVEEKGSKRRRLPLLEATRPLLEFMDLASIELTDLESPLFPALEKDRRTPSCRHLSQQAVLNMVKKYGRLVGLDVSRLGRRGICTHSLRKTSANNALDHGARIEHVQQWLGHADIRTTQSYIHYREEDAETAARRSQIR